MYAVKISDGQVSQVIVGTASWAETRLGGEWMDSPTKVGIGWLLVDGQIVPPPAPPMPDDLTL